MGERIEIEVEYIKPPKDYPKYGRAFFMRAISEKGRVLKIMVAEKYFSRFKPKGRYTLALESTGDDWYVFRHGEVEEMKESRDEISVELVDYRGLQDDCFVAGTTTGDNIGISYPAIQRIYDDLGMYYSLNFWDVESITNLEVMHRYFDLVESGSFISWWKVYLIATYWRRHLYNRWLRQEDHLLPFPFSSSVVSGNLKDGKLISISSFNFQSSLRVKQVEVSLKDVVFTKEGLIYEEVFIPYCLIGSELFGGIDADRYWVAMGLNLTAFAEASFNLEVRYLGRSCLQYFGMQVKDVPNIGEMLNDKEVIRIAKMIEKKKLSVNTFMVREWEPFFIQSVFRASADAVLKGEIYPEQYYFLIRKE